MGRVEGDRIKTYYENLRFNKNIIKNKQNPVSSWLGGSSRIPKYLCLRLLPNKLNPPHVIYYHYFLNLKKKCSKNKILSMHV